MGKRVFVGNLSFQTSDESLREAFEAQGLQVADAHVVVDRDTGQSRGFGFVEFAGDDQAAEAVGRFDGLFVDGRNVRLSEARDREGGPGGPPRSGAGGGFGGAPRPARPMGPPRDGDFRPARPPSGGPPPRREGYGAPGGGYPARGAPRAEGPGPGPREARFEGPSGGDDFGGDAPPRPPRSPEGHAPRRMDGPPPPRRMDGPPPRREFDRPPPRLPRFDGPPPEAGFGDDRPRRRERPKATANDEFKKPKRKMTPDTSAKKKAPRYRDAEDWEDDEDLH